MMNTWYQQIYKSFVIGIVLEAPLACCVLLSGQRIDHSSGLAIICIIAHAPSVALLSVAAKPFARSANDPSFPQALTFAVQAFLFSLIAFVFLIRRRSTTSEHQLQDFERD